jgi:hypothetical protein
MKVILSRKGFDSVAGGYSSILLTKEKRLISLPIPEDNGCNNINTNITYKDLKIFNGTPLSDLMSELGIVDFKDRYVHLDPDINKDEYTGRSDSWRGLFGQCSSAQSHLKNNQVSAGDLFLFFGWFREAERDINGKYRFIKKTDKHIIWGYLQVGEIETIAQEKKYDNWKLYHPHYYYRNSKNNTAYISREKLSFNDRISGYGILNFSDELILTDTSQKNKSLWKLPGCFHPCEGTKMTYHENVKVWETADNNGYCKLHSAGRGQEFIITGNKQVEKWAENIVINNCYGG